MHIINSNCNAKKKKREIGGKIKLKEKKIKEKKEKDQKENKFLQIIKKKWLINGTTTLALVLIIILVFIALNMWMQSLELTPIDLSQEKLYTLTDESKEKVKNIESDFYDIILSFGFVLGGLIILAQLFLVFQFIRPFFIKRSRNSLSFITSIGSILWLGIAYTAGHAFFSTQLAPLLGVYWGISNHLYFNHDIQ